MNHIVKCIEIYGIKPSLTINGRYQYSSALDHILSAISIILIIAFSIYLVNELFSHLYPVIQVTSFNELNPQKIDLNNSNFIIAIGLQDPDYNNFIDESIYTLELKLITETKQRKYLSGNKEEKIIELTRCSNVYMPVLTNYFDKLPLDNLYCIKNKSSLYIEGTFDVSPWTYLEFVFKKCTVNCSSEEVVHDKLHEAYFSLFITDYSLYPKEYNDPIKIFGKNYYTSVDYRAQKRIWTFLKTVQFESDDAWLFHHIQTEKFYAYDSEIEHYILNSDKDDFIHFFVRNAENKQIITRSYIKLDEIIAKSVSMSFIIIWIIQLLSYFFHQMLYKSYICSFYRNETFDKVAGLKKIEIKEGNKAIPSIPYINQLVEPNDKETMQKSKTISLKKEMRNKERSKPRNSNTKEITSNNKSSDFLDVSSVKNRNQEKKIEPLELEMLKKKAIFTKNNIPFGCKTLLSFCLCNIDTIYRFKYVNKSFENIGVYMELVRFLKLYNDVDLIKKLCFDDTHFRLSEHDYSFYKNSEITYAHYKNRFKFYPNKKIGLSLSNLIVQANE